MPDIITIGSATQDVYVFSKQFHVHDDPRRGSGRAEFFAFGTKIELDDIFFEIGGGATNSAFTFHRQGLPVGCIAKVGQDGAGQEVRRILRDCKIKDYLIYDQKQRTGRSVIFLGTLGERTILVYRGAAQSIKPKEIKPARLKAAQWLYVTSLGGNMSVLKKIISIKKSSHTSIFLNPGQLEIRQGKKILNSLLKDVDILLLNRDEAAAITGRAYSNIKGMLLELSALGPGVVLITDGQRGSYLAVDKTFLHVIIKSVKCVDTTGAGDAYGSAFLSGWLRYRGDLHKSLTLASNNAESVVQKIGAKHGLLARGSRLNSSRVNIKRI